MPSTPIAPKRPTEISQHGQTRIDNYFWMRYREDPEVLKYLHAESDYLEEMTRHLTPLQEKLFEEMKARIQENDSTVPEKDGNYFYYLRHEAGKQYPIYCRKNGTLDAPEEIYLDQNVLAEGKAFCRLGTITVSPDGSKLAYSIDPDGSENCVLYFKDLTSGINYQEVIPNTYGNVYDHNGVEWASDNKTVFYFSLDEALRPHKLHRHIVGTDSANDVLILQEDDETFSPSLFKPKSGAYIFVYFYSTNTRETRYIESDKPEGEFKIFHPRESGLEYFATHHHDMFYVATNDGNAVNMKLMQTSIHATGKENWKELIPHREDTLIEGMEAFENHFVLFERRNGLQQFRVSKPDAVSDVLYINFPEPVYDVESNRTPEFNSNIFRFTYTSLVTPNSVIDFHMDSNTWVEMKRDEVPSGYDANLFISERLFASAPDGVQVPISIVYKKGLQKDGKNPCYLTSYGSYGASSSAFFDSARLSLLERGFVFAIAHIRGGSEMGRQWYDDGKMLKKKNTFTDFIASAEHLIKEGYTSKDKLAIRGISAGGLLMGAVVVMRPDLFKAVIADVPFVDVVNTMNDASIPLTTLEYDQWGNPTHKEHFEYLMSYSPYDNIQATNYPHMLMTTGLNDPRVSYWEPAKFTAKLRELKTDDNLLLLKTNYEAGHQGASGRYEYLKEWAFKYAFVIDRLTIDD